MARTFGYVPYLPLLWGYACNSKGCSRSEAVRNTMQKHVRRAHARHEQREPPFASGVPMQTFFLGPDKYYLQVVLPTAVVRPLRPAPACLLAAFLQQCRQDLTSVPYSISSYKVNLWDKKTRWIKHLELSHDQVQLIGALRTTLDALVPSRPTAAVEIVISQLSINVIKQPITGDAIQSPLITSSKE